MAAAVPSHRGCTIGGQTLWVPVCKYTWGDLGAAGSGYLPVSDLGRETSFGLLSARRDQRRRRHGRKDPISKNLEKSSTFCEIANCKFVKNHSCIATSRPLPGSQQLPLVLQTTPLAPQVPPGSTPIDGGGILLFLDFRHFRPPCASTGRF